MEPRSLAPSSDCFTQVISPLSFCFFDCYEMLFSESQFCDDRHVVCCFIAKALRLSAYGLLMFPVCVSRPFQRTVTMHKDSSGHVGFIYKNGKITSLVKDGSAARNGLLTEHYICEINGQNVIGLKVRLSLLQISGFSSNSLVGYFVILCVLWNLYYDRLSSV